MPGQPLTSCPTRCWGKQLLGLEGPTPRLLPSLPLVNTEESGDPTFKKQAFVFINQREGSQSQEGSYQSLL